MLNKKEQTEKTAERKLQPCFLLWKYTKAYNTAPLTVTNNSLYQIKYFHFLLKFIVRNLALNAIWLLRNTHRWARGSGKTALTAVDVLGCRDVQSMACVPSSSFRALLCETNILPHLSRSRRNEPHTALHSVSRVSVSVCLCVCVCPPICVFILMWLMAWLTWNHSVFCCFFC